VIDRPPITGGRAPCQRLLPAVHDKALDRIINMFDAGPTGSKSMMLRLQGQKGWPPSLRSLMVASSYGAMAPTHGMKFRTE
jgi:hypothetical protein